MSLVPAPTFGGALRQARANQGVSLAALARLVHYSPGYLSRVERGQRSPTLALARRCDEALGADGALAALVPVRAPARRRAALTQPAQLPGEMPYFVGRAGAIAQLQAAADCCAARVSTVVIAGAPGVGKTALAVHFAHRAAAGFPDGQLYVALHGFGPAAQPVTPSSAVCGFLQALGVPPDRIPAGLDAQAALYRSLLSGRRMLIVADNARDASQIRPLLPGAPGCLVVVTSRSQLSGLVTENGARCIDLGVLTIGESHELLAARLGGNRVAAEPQAAAEIIGRCGRFPLALAIVAARAAAHPNFALAALASELGGTEDGRLDALDGGEPAADVRAVFSWSYQQLDAAAARLFRLLGLHPGPDITVAAAASLAGYPARQARRALATLADMHLATEHCPGRYACHDLLRDFAAELTRTVDPVAERHAATGRLLDHYLRTAHAAALLFGLEPIHGPVTLPTPFPGVEPEQPADQATAQAWFTAERPVLLAAVSHAAATGWDVHAWQLAWTLRDYLARRGYFDDLLASQRTALEATVRLGDCDGQARAQSGLGSACGWLGRHDEAIGHLRCALELFAERHATADQAMIYLDLGWVRNNQGRFADALAYAEHALAMYRAAGDRNGEATTLNNIGWARAQLGDYQHALAYCKQSVALHRELGDPLSEARALDSIGYVLHHLGHHQRAIACYERAITLNREHGSRFGEAHILDQLGDIYYAEGHTAAARDAWLRALDIFGQLSQPGTGQILVKIRNLDEDQARTG